MNAAFQGIRALALAALVASSPAGAETPAVPVASSTLQTNATHAPPSAPTNSVPNASATNTPADSSPALPRPDRDGPRSRRSDRRRDRTDASSAGSATATATNLPARGTEFSSFRIIPDRNIFNVNRAGLSSRPPREAPPKSVQVETFALVGAMSYAKGDFAFFDGSSSDFRKVLKLGDSIAGFQIKSIGLSSVRLDEAGKSIELAIGSHFRREDHGEWRLVAESAPSSSSSDASGRKESETSAGSGPSTEGGTKTASTDSGGDANDILQRLMKKRETELVK